MNVFLDVINVAGVILEILIALSYFKAISNKKQISTCIEMVIIILGIVMQSVVIVVVRQQMVVTAILFLLIMGLSFAYKLSILKRIVFSIILMMLYLLSEMVIGLVLTMILDVSVEMLSSNVLYYMQGALISKLLMFVVIKVVGFFSVKSEAKIPGYVYIPLMALPVATCLVVYVLAEFTFESQADELLAMSTIAAMFLIIANILVFYLFEHHIRLTDARNREELIKQQLEYNVEYYKEVSHRQQITNKTMHDLKNQLFALREILKNNPQDGIDRINTICDEVLSSYSLRFTGIESVDALITAKVQVMEENSIRWSNSIYISEDNSLDVLDVCVLLGNLLDNAIEANSKVPAQDKYVSLKITQQFDFLSINVGNAVSEVVKIDKFGIATTKKDKEFHGFGLQSVKEIVNKYTGNCTFRQEQNKFETIIILKNIQ